MGTPPSTPRPQRSPLPDGAETFTARGSAWRAHLLASTKSVPRRSGDGRWPLTTCGRGCLNEVRSPKERRPADLDGVADAGVHASTKCAPRRSGDERQRSTRSAYRSPQRSPLPERAETGDRDTDAADPAPQRGPLPERAETCRARRGCSRGSRLNEVRSPKERRPPGSTAMRSRPTWPQRSPLPEGAETRRG